MLEIQVIYLVFPYAGLKKHKKMYKKLVFYTIRQNPARTTKTDHIDEDRRYWQRDIGASMAEWDWLEWQQIELLRQQVLVLEDSSTPTRAR